MCNKRIQIRPLCTFKIEFEIREFEKVMFPIYHSLYKHLPPLFPQQAGSASANGSSAPNDHLGLSKLDLPSMNSTNHFLAAAAAAAMEAAVANSSKLDQRSGEESISPSPPVVTASELSSKPFLKFSVNAILSKAAKAEQTNNSDQEENAVKTTSENQTEGKNFSS